MLGGPPSSSPSSPLPLLPFCAVKWILYSSGVCLHKCMKHMAKSTRATCSASPVFECVTSRQSAYSDPTVDAKERFYSKCSQHRYARTHTLTWQAFFTFLKKTFCLSTGCSSGGVRQSSPARYASRETQPRWVGSEPAGASIQPSGELYFIYFVLKVSLIQALWNCCLVSLII